MLQSHLGVVSQEHALVCKEADEVVGEGGLQMGDQGAAPLGSRQASKADKQVWPVPPHLEVPRVQLLSKHEEWLGPLLGNTMHREFEEREWHGWAGEGN